MMKKMEEGEEAADVILVANKDVLRAVKVILMCRFSNPIGVFGQDQRTLVDLSTSEFERMSMTAPSSS